MSDFRHRKDNNPVVPPQESEAAYYRISSTVREAVDSLVRERE